ncbi:DUF262 domain-containing protein [Nonomuraea bangladeshensis]|uniref:DUF262 domain-containing protein n=1 Tax=Nonomuraea bangladeshensis TaxID=404385 RepID=A0ABV3HE96_9ACTN
MPLPAYDLDVKHGAAIPLYQRHYTWERPQLTAADGQRRLTTLMLALCAIRDHLVAEEPSARERINDLHLINKFQQGELRYRLLPTQGDRAAFKACVDGASDGRSDSLIGNAYQFFRGMLKEFDDPADPHDIARVESVLLDRLNLVQILVEKDDNAFRIFESINNTGMRLSQVDPARLYWPSDAQLREEIRSRAFYWQGRTVQQKLILRRPARAIPAPAPRPP